LDGVVNTVNTIPYVKGILEVVEAGGLCIIRSRIVTTERKDLKGSITPQADIICLHTHLILKAE
jgi:hypothetical protein